MKPSNTETQEVERAITNSEQAADLAALQGMAAPAPGEGQDTQEQQHQGPDLATELEGLITGVVAVLSPMFPSLKETYTDTTTKAAAGAVAAVCTKHGWLGGGVFGEWGEEIAAAAIVGPLAFATYQGIKSDIAARTPDKPERIGGPSLEASAPGEMAPSKTVTFGAPVPAQE